MFNVATKPTAILCATLLVGALSSCNNGKEAEAMALYEDAKALYDTHLYDSTLSVLDTLYKRYPAETDVIRQGIHLMAQAQEQISIAGIAQADSVIAANAPIVKKIAKDFVVVKNPDLVENYRIYKTLKNNPLINRTGLEPRVDDNGNIYLVSLLQGRAIKHTSLRVTAADGRSAETASVPYDDAQNYRFTTDGVSNEMVTFHADQCNEFCKFIANNATGQLQLEFVGKSTYRIPLPASLKEAISQSYIYSVAIQAGLKAEGEKLYYGKRLEVAKKQIEQTMPH